MKSRFWCAALAVCIATLVAMSATTNASRLKYHKNPLKQWPALRHLRTSTTAVAQASTVTAMIARLLGKQRARYFTVTVNASLIEQGRDVFVIDDDSDGAGIRITGSTGVAAAMGFQYYAKTFGGCHFSWSGNQVATLTSPPPRLPAPIKVVANDLFRYYQNVCTVSYSSVWWNWTRWEQEIDWMALNGINLPLAFTGQEAIWRRVYLALGFSQTDLDAFFSGPAFLAWNRMGNVDGWGGPIPEEYYEGQLQLQHLILDRMRGFGMMPVLPAFSGHVPQTIENYFPNVTVTRLADWGGFNATYCCSTLLDHNETLFQTIGRNFISEMSGEFGVDHVYNCDTFNEMEPPTTDPAFISGVGHSIYSAITAVDPMGIWVMQGWLFKDDYFWNTTLAEALLMSVPLGRMIVLDLYSEMSPQYLRLESYFGQPWIWCMLHNFGGVKGLYGTVDNVNTGPFVGRALVNSTMVGTGLTPEGIEQNDVMYELMNEMAYLRVPVVLDDWFPDYALRRYGGVFNADIVHAWRLMARTVFNCTEFPFHGKYVLTTRPTFKLQPTICYNENDFLAVWDDFITAAQDESAFTTSDLFRHDLVDISREALVVVATNLHLDMTRAYVEKNFSNFRESAVKFLDLLADVETLLATDRHFLLGSWLASARDLATNITDAYLYEYNARNQITLWGPAGEIVDYATKQWSGVVGDYYLPRWRLFVDVVQLCLDTDTPFVQSQFNQAVFDIVESPFTFSTKSYPVDPKGDSVDVAVRLYVKWRINQTEVNTVN